MIEEQEKIIVEAGGKTLTLAVRNFSAADIDIEDLLQVQMNDLMLDVVTFPVILNRIAIIKADIDGMLREEQFDLKVFYAQLYQDYKKAFLTSGEKATETALDMAILRDPGYIAKQKKIFLIQKNADILDGLYWSAKSKDKKLDTISVKVKPEEFEKEIIEGVINSVFVRSQKSTFPSKNK